jgi:anion-transporting  ArsA/GET3 family ATPase
MTIEELKEKALNLNLLAQLYYLKATVVIETPEQDAIEEQERIEMQRKAFEAARKYLLHNRYLYDNFEEYLAVINK